MKTNKTIIDAKNATLGRLASYAAKQALLGKEIIIVNCNEAIIIGKPRSIIEEYNAMRRLGGSSQHGPFFPKSPERIVKRTIRGMLSHRQGRGADAFKRVMCFDDVPQEYMEAKKIQSGRETTKKSIKLKDLSREI